MTDKVGVDDFLADGGSVADLLMSASGRPPKPAPVSDDSLTDSRLAERVAAEALAGRFRYARGLGWLRYDGRRWEEVGEEHVVEAVRVFHRKLLTDAAQSNSDVARLNKLAGLQSASKIRSVAGLTKGMEGIATDATDFDADPWLLNAGNGVVDLRTGELNDHNPGLLMRHLTPVVYRPRARHNDWLKAVMALPDVETIHWMQRFLGSGATGLTPREDIATFWHGQGANGKSTVLGAVQAALGDYAKALLPTMLGGNRQEHPTEFMDLMGVRFAFIEETGDNHRLDTVKLKRYLGTEEITGRKMRQDSVSFRPSHTLVITTNHRPQVTDTDHGTWRRLRMVPFARTFGRDGNPSDRGLRSRLMDGRSQLEAVLAWLVAGAGLWYRDGMVLPPDPQSVTTATKLWRESTDLIYTFVEERVVAEEGSFVETEVLRAAFNEWLPPPHQGWGKQTFGERFDNHEAMQKLCAVRGHHPQTRRAGFSGIRLRAAPGRA